MQHEETPRGTPDAAPVQRYAPDRCPHEGFATSVAINRLLDTGKCVADIKIHCVQCDEAFRFVGIPAGLRFDGPTVSIDETELHVPIEPEGEKRLQTSALFQMPAILKRN